MTPEEVLALISVYKEVDQKLDKIISLVDDHTKIRYTYEVKQECLQLAKEIDLVLANGYKLNINEKEKMILEWYHEQTQNMIQVIIKSVSG